MKNQSSKAEDVKLNTETQDDKGEDLWNLDFDGAVSKEGERADVWILD